MPTIDPLYLGNLGKIIYSVFPIDPKMSLLRWSRFVSNEKIVHQQNVVSYPNLKW